MRAHYCARGSRIALSSLPPLPYRATWCTRGDTSRGLNSLRPRRQSCCGSAFCLLLLLASRARFARDSIHHTRREEERGWAHEANVKIPARRSCRLVVPHCPRSISLSLSRSLALLSMVSLSLCRDILLRYPCTSERRLVARKTVDETRGFTADNTHATVSSPLSFPPSLYR
jgi:hypothetical protein